MGSSCSHPAAVNDAAVRWIATTAAINDLIENGLSVWNALEDGLLILEIDQIGGHTNPALAASQAEQYVHQFARMTAEIQRQISNSLARKPEAVHVG